VLATPRILIRKTPTETSQLVPGTLFAIKGDGEGVEMLPAQVFRFERFGHMSHTGTVLLMGTLWWQIEVAGRQYSGKDDKFWTAVHHVNIGLKQNDRHNFHLEEITRQQVKDVLGFGKIYGEFAQDYQRQKKNERRELISA
jgi:hypothetical protein